jgi:hypothetical protein
LLLWSCSGVRIIHFGQVQVNSGRHQQEHNEWQFLEELEMVELKKRLVPLQASMTYC